MKIVFQTAPHLWRERYHRTRKALDPAYVVTKKKQKMHPLLKRVVRSLLALMMVFSLVVTCVLVVPDLYYRVFPADTTPVKAREMTVTTNQASPSATPSPRPLPPQDPSLPDGEWVVIPKIGVRSQPMVTENPEDALQKGIWQVPDYGKPGEVGVPIILAAHRFGWQWWWKTDYWKYNSFYRLPDLKVGDQVQIISDHRKWVYEIYSAQEGEEITDYSADLIMYTCKFLNSPVRYFRYARLVPQD